MKRKLLPEKVYRKKLTDIMPFTCLCAGLSASQINALILWIFEHRAAFLCVRFADIVDILTKYEQEEY